MNIGVLSGTMMQTIIDIARVFGLLFIIGLPVLIVVGAIIAKAVDRAKKRTMKIAEEASVEVTLKPDRGPSVSEIEGIVYCIGFIVIGVIVVVAGVLGISLPLDLSEDMENIIGTTAFGIFDVLIWSVVIWSPFYYRNEKRRLQRAIEDALSKKGL